MKFLLDSGQLDVETLVKRAVFGPQNAVSACEHGIQFDLKRAKLSKFASDPVQRRFQKNGIFRIQIQDETAFAGTKFQHFTDPLSRDLGIGFQFTPNDDFGDS